MTLATRQPASAGRLERSSLRQRLVGSDAGTEIALVKIQAKGLSAAPIGDSEQLWVGDVVLAIGNPFGLGQTVTSAIVSALGHSGLNAQSYEDFIHTDAASKAVGANIGGVEKASPPRAQASSRATSSLKIDGKPVLNASDVRNRIGLCEVGSHVSLTVLLAAAAMLMLCATAIGSANSIGSLVPAALTSIRSQTNAEIWPLPIAIGSTAKRAAASRQRPNRRDC
jgi:S1-C subfamily serine protease